MSDPVTNVEIEDVLSSIRRLVSEGEKARRVATGVAEPDPVVDDAADTAPAPTPADVMEKLVLTPALRVAGPADEIEPATPPEVTEDDPLDPPAPSDRASLEATIAELEAAVIEQDDEWEPDGSEVKTRAPAWGDVSDTDAANSGDAPDADSADVDNSNPFGPDRLILALSAAKDIPRDLDQKLVDFAEPEVIATAEHAAIAEPVEEAPVVDIEALVDQVSEVAEQVAVSDVLAAATQPMDDAAPEQDEDAGDRDPAEDAVAFRHLAAHDTVSGHDLTGEATVDEDETLEAFLARGGGVDHAALRAMVLDIVRAELQGPLGERITRNVRKLVRREIMRVLNAQEMDQS